MPENLRFLLSNQKQHEHSENDKTACRHVDNTHNMSQNTKYLAGRYNTDTIEPLHNGHPGDRKKWPL